MALVHPTRRQRVSKGEPHPALCLLAGFAFMSLVATGIHLLFGLL